MDFGAKNEDIMKVKLTYFKRSGKYYTDYIYETKKEHCFQIFEEVIEKRDNGTLPMSGDHWNILVEPQGENGYPAMVFAK